MPKKITPKNFHSKFQSEDDCRQYLFDLKWKKGYCCSKCGHTQFWKGRTAFNRRCRKCRYDESVVANTIFHKLKIPLLKAFKIAFHFAHSKSGASSLDLARQYGINQKTAWYFKRKLQQCLLSAIPDKKRGSLHFRSLVVDSILISRREPGANGLQKFHLMEIEIQSEDRKGKKVKMKSLLPDVQKRELSDLVRGKFKQQNPDINAWNFKVWLTGTHHHCSAKYLQGYVDEYWFRFNHRHQKNAAWNELLCRIMFPQATNFNGCAN